MAKFDENGKQIFEPGIFRAADDVTVQIDEIVPAKFEGYTEKDIPTKSLTIQSQHEVAAKQTEALTVLASATKQIADFISGGGLSTLLSGYARSQAVKDILGGLAAHDGRNSLDARTLGQNALEITEAVELVFKKYAERLAEKERDPEVHVPPEEYKPLRERT